MMRFPLFLPRYTHNEHHTKRKLDGTRGLFRPGPSRNNSGSDSGVFVMVILASATLEKTILDNAPPHYAADNAPNTWKELKAWREAHQGAPMPVYSGGCDNTIYSSKAVNHAFRAWHDQLHLDHGLSFTPDNEARVALLHMEECANVADALLIFADVYGQVLYYEKHKKYVPNQRQFINDFIKRGFLL